MTAPQIPAPNVNINPQFVPNTQPGGLEVFLRALERRRELDLEKQKLARDQEQFELNKRLAGTQIEGAELLNLQRKRELADKEDDLKAQDEALRLYTGSLPHADDMDAWGEVITGVKDKRVARHLMASIRELFTIRAMQPNWQAVPTESGSIMQLNPETGATRPTGLRAPAPAGGATAALTQKIRLGAKNAAQAIRQAVELVARDPDANYKPVLSDVAGSAAESRLAGWVPGLKGGAGYLRRRAMSANQQKFQNLLNIVAHNSVGLLPGTRQSIVLFQNLRDSYSTDAGDSPELRAQKLALLADLGASLTALSRGEDASLAHLPGFEEFAPLGLPGAPTQPAQQSAPLSPPSVDGGTVTPQQPKRKRWQENPY